VRSGGECVSSGNKEVLLRTPRLRISGAHRKNSDVRGLAILLIAFDYVSSSTVSLLRLVLLTILETPSEAHMTVQLS
jgi:hypothetical protein